MPMHSAPHPSIVHSVTSSGTCVPPSTRTSTSPNSAPGCSPRSFSIRLAVDMMRVHSLERRPRAGGHGARGIQPEVAGARLGRTMSDVDYFVVRSVLTPGVCEKELLKPLGHPVGERSHSSCVPSAFEDEILQSTTLGLSAEERGECEGPRHQPCRHLTIASCLS